MFKNFLPNKIFSISIRFFNLLITAMILVIFIGLFYVLKSPSDYIQGDSVRIMYVHVPSSILGLGCFAIMAITSILNLIFKIKLMSIVSKSIAPVGLVFTFISIITGSLWAKPTWGVWWVWDARLTSMIILLFFYLIYICIWKYVSDFDKASKISSLIAIVGSFNLPVIKYSVDWWNTLHQPSSITLTSAPTIHYTMLIPLIIMLIGLLIYVIVVFLMKYKTELIKFKLNIKRNKKD